MRRLGSWVIVLMIVAAWAWFQWRDLQPREPKAIERVSGRFTVCGRGASSFGCVHDGDSFRLGKRKIRVQHIDAPEMAGQCEAERALALRSRDRLVALLNQGPFTMETMSERAVDQYGRELRVLSRTRGDKRELIGDVLVREGLAHRYVNHKTGWC